MKVTLDFKNVMAIVTDRDGAISLAHNIIKGVMAGADFCHIKINLLQKDQESVIHDELVENVKEKLLSYCNQGCWLSLDAERDARKIVEMVRNWEPKKL